MAKDLEGFAPDSDGRASYEYRHRYGVCASVVAGKTVLNLACGEGGGAEILARSADQVVGVDADADAVARASRKFAENARLAFKPVDFSRLPFEDGSFDVVVAFEAIGRIAEPEALLKEAARVLRKSGALIVSAPARADGSGGADAGAFDRTAFEALLRSAFSHVHLYGQRFFVPSLIAPLELSRSQKPAIFSLVAKDQRPEPGAPALGSVDCFVAVCGNAPVRKKLEAPSLFVDESVDLWRERERLFLWASDLHEADEKLRARLREIEGALARAREAQAHAAQDVGDRLVRELRQITASTQNLFHRDLAELRQDVSRLSESEQLRSELLEARLERERADDENAALQDALAKAKRTGDELSSQASLLRRALEKAETDARNAREAEAALREVYEDAARLVEERGALLADAQEKIAASGAETARLRAELSESNEFLDNAREALARAQADAAFLRQTQDELNAEIAALREAREGLGQQIAALEKDLESRATAILDLEKEVEESAKLRRRFEEQAEVIAGLTADVEEAEAELGRRQDLLSKYMSATASQRATLQRLDQQVRVIGVKRAVEAQFAAAVRTVRVSLWRLPLIVFRGRLRSTVPMPPLRSLGRSERKDIENSKLFDPQWYLAQNPDVAQHGIDPLVHYLRNGFAEDRDPHPYFNAAWYRALYGDRLEGLPPLVHYLRNGKSRFMSPHPLFDAGFYLQRNDDVAQRGVDPLDHFIASGEEERRNPHPLVWLDRLAEQSGLDSEAKPFAAYLSDPRHALASPHPLFDPEFYFQDNPDLLRQGVCPLMHYCAIGWREGREPFRAFAGDWYLARNPDVLEAQINPLVHFVRFGAYEQRSPHPLFDLPFYLERNRDALAAECDALSHYVLSGASQQLETNEKISVADMKSIVPDAYWRRFDPVSAFTYFGETRISVPTQPRGSEIDVNQPGLGAWPPAPDFTYWLPQQLRDYIIERFGENQLPLYIYFMAMVDRYGDAPEAFAESDDFRVMRERLLTHCRKRRPRRHQAIDVSIIVPVYNNLIFTLTCVLSVLENGSRFSFEIIIGDDKSSDATEEVFSTAGGPIVHVRHAENRGFLGNCNAAAEVAKGRFVVFLNNDTLTFPGWLDELIGVFERDETVGFSGSKLLNGDGTLQEAGGIYWRDGSAWNFGRNSDPRLPEFNYCKDVDYISGASIALPTNVWKRLEGFDPIYAPAYCEDADIAFRVRDIGMRTVYVPQSELIHHEGRSHGRDTGSGIKAYQIANQEKLLARWRSVLEKDHFPNAENVFLARDRSRHRPHILVVDHYIPQWDRDAGSRNMYHYIRMFLQAGFRVTLWPDNLNEDREYCAPLQRAGVEVIYSAAYAGRFDDFIAANGKYFDYALLSRPHISIKYYDSLRAHSRCGILYYGHDIHFKRMEREYEISRNPELRKAIDETRAQEMENWRKADIVLYPSVEEREEVRRLMPTCVAEALPLFGYLPSELSTAYANLARFEARNPDELLFVGGPHPPNVDGLRWFVADVMPLILAQRPSVRLIVVGSMTSPEIARLESESVVLKGRLSDEELAELYATAGAAIVPLRFGAGVKGKTLEALMNSTPLVTTSTGMQGLFPTEPISYVADKSEALAEAVLACLSDREEARAIVTRGVAYIEANYSIEALRRAFAPFIIELAEAGKEEQLRRPTEAQPSLQA